MSRRTGQHGNDDYGTSAKRKKPVGAYTLEQVREKIALNPTALSRLRRIVDSEATEAAPLVYETRAPYGTTPLLRWRCIEVKNVDDRIHVWPLPFGIEVLGGGG